MTECTNGGCRKTPARIYYLDGINPVNLCQECENIYERMGKASEMGLGIGFWVLAFIVVFLFLGSMIK